jgi:uncharacterized membrane protein YccC
MGHFVSCAERGAVWADKLRPFLPALLFGLRLWAAVCLALYVAFQLELENAQWAGTSAAIVCQASLGASLRKGAFRMIGTVIGAVAVVLLAACFPQNRVGFLLGMALWGSACGVAATTLRNFTAYGAALAGYTAAVIGNDALGATGGTNGAVFMLAIDRAAAICIGILCAAVVVVSTDFGGAARRLAGQLADISAAITGGFAATFALPASQQAATRNKRRAFVARLVALGPVIDEAIGEISRLRYRARILQAAVDSLFSVLSGWRTVAACIERLPDGEARRNADIVFSRLPSMLQAARSDPAIWVAEPARLRLECRAAARSLAVLPADTPALQLVADATARALFALSHALEGLALLKDGQSIAPRRRAVRHPIADPLPAIVNAVRVFVTIGAVELFWVVTAWPHGALAVTFAAVGIILFSPQEDRAYASAKTFMIGTGLAAVAAGLIDFAVLPSLQSFLAFSLSLGLVLVPIGALSIQPWQGPVFVAMTVNFIPLLAPANPIAYDTLQFYNTTLAIMSGAGAAMLGMVLLPPLPPALRVRRLLKLTLRDLRRVATGEKAWTMADWEGRVYSRLVVLPASAEAQQLSSLVAALSAGGEIIQLRRLGRQLGLMPDIDMALHALATGGSAAAIRRLADLDDRLAALPRIGPNGMARLRARSRILAVSEVLAQQAAYFDGRYVG